MPLSMLLFALCVEPLLCILDQKLSLIRNGKRAQKTVVVVYADADGPTCHSKRHTMLRKSHGSSPKNEEIENISGWRMEYIHGYVEHIPR